MKKRAYKFAIIGAGMVGTAIGFLLKKSGHTIAAVADLSTPHLQRAKTYIGTTGYRDSAEAASLGDCILISTPDDRILEACTDLARRTSLEGKKVFHMSGAGGLDLLEPAAKAGAAIASIHPLQSFSSIDGAIANIPGSYFGVTTGVGAKQISTALVRDLKGIPLFISPAQKPLYHAAACIASNYLVSLMSVVESIYMAIGIKEKDARRAYLPLVYGSLKNVENQGCARALTGPIARGDAGTIEKHIEAFTGNLSHHVPFYTELGKITVDLARQKGTLSVSQAQKIIALLKGANHEHSK